MDFAQGTIGQVERWECTIGIFGLAFVFYGIYHQWLALNSSRKYDRGTESVFRPVTAVSVCLSFEKGIPVRIKVLAIALLATVAMLQSVSQAAFVMGGSIFLENNTAVTAANIKGQLKYEVWSTDAYGVALGAGEFGYFFQIKNLSPSQSIENFGIAGSYTTLNLGTVGGLLLGGGVGPTVAPGGGTIQPLPFANTGSQIYWNFQVGAEPIKVGEYSDIMFFVAANGPELANVGSLRSPQTASGMVPVPVPLPPAIFLALAGLPFLRALGRKK